MRRLTEKEVLNNYIETGAIPMSGAYFYEKEGTCWACGLTVCAIQEIEDFLSLHAKYKSYPNDDHFYKTLAIHMGLEPEYIRGFVDGFDCHRETNRVAIDIIMGIRATTAERKIGIQDGLACAAAVMEKFGNILERFEVEDNVGKF